MDLAALYERIVSLVPVEELLDGYNAALSEDLSPLKRAVDDASAAFAKLEEVRDAVHKLEGVNGSTTSRSSSLVEVLDSTMHLQQQLKKKVEATLALMTRKEKRTQQHDEERETKRMKAEKTQETTARSPKKERKQTEKANRDEAKPEGNETHIESSPWVNKLSETKYFEVLRMMTQLSVAERNTHIPGVLSKLETILPCQTEQDQISTLKYMILWAHVSIGQGGDSRPFLQIANTVTTMINKLPQTDVLVGMKRLNESLHEFLKEDSSGKEHAKPSGNAQLSYDLQIWRANAMTPYERRKHVHEVVSALEGKMMREMDDPKQAFETVKAVKTVAQWARSDGRSPNLIKMYTRLADHVRTYAGRVEHFGVKAELLREARKLEVAVGNVDGERAQDKAERVLAAVKHLPQNVSAEELGEWILKLDEVIYHHERGWKPRTNPIVCECYQQLLQRAESQKKGTARRQRIIVMKKWKFHEPQ